MTEHELKTWPEPFQALVDGCKTFEWRRNDRGYEVGDLLVLREWVPPGFGSEGYTGRELRVEVTYVLAGRFGIPEGYAVLAIRAPHRLRNRRRIDRRDEVIFVGTINGTATAVEKRNPRELNDWCHGCGGCHATKSIAWRCLEMAMLMRAAECERASAKCAAKAEEK